MVMSADAKQQAIDSKPQKSRFGHLSNCLGLLAPKRNSNAVSERLPEMPRDHQTVAAESASTAKPEKSAQTTRTQAPNQHSAAKHILGSKKKETRVNRNYQSAHGNEQTEQLGVFKRKSRTPINTQASLGTPARPEHLQEKPQSQEESMLQDPSTMTKSTLDLSRAAALAKQIKANGGKLPEEELAQHSASAEHHAPVKKRKLAASALVDTESVKTEVSEHVNAVQRAARNTLAANIEKSGLLADNSSAQEASAKIEQMVQDIVDLYVPLFERELRITLENDILDKLSQGTEV